MSRKLHAFYFLKFSCVGTLTAIIFFLVMWCWDFLFPAHYIFAVTLAYISSTAFHYFTNQRFTFNTKSCLNRIQISRYIVVCILNYFITVLVVSISVDAYLLSRYLGVFLSIIFTAITGYVLGYCWVFRAQRKDL